ncbi:MAG TPA: hypothetical protein EYN06_02220 [Myxococcales bacterium]|nr:hypothetical protein [Myxococcales bacterium]
MKSILIVLSLSFCLAAIGCTTSQTITDPPGTTSGTSSGTGGTTGGTCASNCNGKQCGPDLCGGFCGVCSAGSACNAQGLCQQKACSPKCSGKQCGPNGCGGSCGACPTNTACNGAGQCTTGGTNNCLPNCIGKVCGDDGCGNLCGKCHPGQACNLSGQCTADNSACGGIDAIGECQQDNTIAVTCKAGKLIAVICDPAKGLICGYNAIKNKYDCIKSGCSPSCFGKQCGPDGCGGLCGQCQPNQNCNSSGKCQTGSGCQPSCANKQCGPDGCGGLCGICPGGQNCGPTGLCVSSNCTPNCVSKQCGSDGCSGSCGTCKPSEQCNAGYKCVASGCSPNCTGKDCGADGCGGSCGLCPQSQNCDVAGHCVTIAGGSCGNLTYEGACTNNSKTVQWCENGAIKQQDCLAYGPNFVCSWVAADEYYWCLNQCEANCVNKECGDNGCGSNCGVCADDKTCNNVGQCKTTGGGGECGNISFEGTCEGNTLKYCSSGSLITSNCGQYGKLCKWNSAANNGSGWYECQKSDTGCTPNCIISVDNQSVPKECGDDGCGNACGVCIANQVCDEGLCINTGVINDCGGIGDVGKCEANILTYCLNGNLYSQDCGATDEICEYDDLLGTNDCSEVDDAGTGCGNAVTEKGLCIGNSVTECLNSSVMSFNCSEMGLYCMYDPSISEYQCLTNPGCENSCSAEQRCQKDGICGCDGIDVNGVCENNTLVWCGGDKLTIEDCSQDLETCLVSDTGFANCQ